MSGPKFTEELVYSDRETKQAAVAKRYSPILKGKVLDVGADQLYLRSALSGDVDYTAVGLGDHPDQVVVDLEEGKLPFSDGEFDCVVCLDVLEHLESIHQVFDELCRVSKSWVLISLPNPYNTLLRFLEVGKYTQRRNIKYYGLMPDAEPDRHKWFFSSKEAREFINQRSGNNGFEVYDLVTPGAGNQGLPEDARKSTEIKKARELLFRHDIDFSEFYEGTQWWVLQKS